MTQDTRKSAPRRKRGFSAVPFFGDFVAFTRLLRDKEAGWGPKLLVLVAIAYVVSPVDAIPEFIAPAIGWLDDVGLVLALRLLMTKRLDPYRYPLFGAAPARERLPEAVDDASDSPGPSPAAPTA